MTRVVFDTVGFVRGLINPYDRWGRLIFDHRDDYELVVSAPLVTEVLDVFKRRRVRRRFQTVGGRDLRALLTIIERAIVVEVADEVQTPLLRDLKDNHVLATAVASAAEYIITEDKDLLVLGAHRGIVICDAAAFLDVIGHGGS